MDESQFFSWAVLVAVSLDPHGLSCNFGASEKFACCICFIGLSGPKLQEITVGIYASKLGFRGWMGALFC